MGIIHHGSYLRWMEEARVEFFRKSGLLKDASLDDINYPVLNLEIDYKKSVLFDDEFSIILTGKIEGARVYFLYEIRIKRFTEPVAFGKTVHVALDMKTKRPIRIPEALAQLLP
jgi:acyl-CoA thioester hydrolase